MGNWNANVSNIFHGVRLEEVHSVLLHICCGMPWDAPDSRDFNNTIVKI